MAVLGQDHLVALCRQGELECLPHRWLVVYDEDPLRRGSVEGHWGLVVSEELPEPGPGDPVVALGNMVGLLFAGPNPAQDRHGSDVEEMRDLPGAQGPLER